MTYFVAIHKDRDSSYGVSVPDLPGCVTAGDTPAEALRLAREAVRMHLEGMFEDGVAVPEPTEDIDFLRAHPDFADASFWAAVDVPLDWRASSAA